MRENVLLGILGAARLVGLSSAQVYGSRPDVGGAGPSPEDPFAGSSPLPTITFTIPGTSSAISSGEVPSVPTTTGFGPVGPPAGGYGGGPPLVTEITTLTNGLTLTYTIFQSTATVGSDSPFPPFYTPSLPDGSTTLIPGFPSNGLIPSGASGSAPEGPFTSAAPSFVPGNPLPGVPSVVVPFPGNPTVSGPEGPFPGLPTTSSSEGPFPESTPPIIPFPGLPSSFSPGPEGPFTSLGFGGETCPVPSPTTVFITIPPSALTIVQTITSLVTIPGPISPSEGSLSIGAEPSSWYPVTITTIPCLTSSSSLPWFTEFPSFTLSSFPSETESIPTGLQSVTLPEPTITIAGIPYVPFPTDPFGVPSPTWPFSDTDLSDPFGTGIPTTSSPPCTTTITVTPTISLGSGPIPTDFGPQTTLPGAGPEASGIPSASPFPPFSPFSVGNGPIGPWGSGFPSPFPDISPISPANPWDSTIPGIEPTSFPSVPSIPSIPSGPEISTIPGFPTPFPPLFSIGTAPFPSGIETSPCPTDESGFPITATPFTDGIGGPLPVTPFGIPGGPSDGIPFPTFPFPISEGSLTSPGEGTVTGVPIPVVPFSVPGLDSSLFPPFLPSSFDPLTSLPTSLPLGVSTIPSIVPYGVSTGPGVVTIGPQIVPTSIPTGPGGLPSGLLTGPGSVPTDFFPSSLPIASGPTGPQDSLIGPGGIPASLPTILSGLPTIPGSLLTDFSGVPTSLQGIPTETEGPPFAPGITVVIPTGTDGLPESGILTVEGPQTELPTNLSSVSSDLLPTELSVGPSILPTGPSGVPTGVPTGPEGLPTPPVSPGGIPPSSSTSCSLDSLLSGALTGAGFTSIPTTLITSTPLAGTESEGPIPTSIASPPLTSIPPIPTAPPFANSSVPATPAPVATSHTIDLSATPQPDIFAREDEGFETPDMITESALSVPIPSQGGYDSPLLPSTLSAVIRSPGSSAPESRDSSYNCGNPADTGDFTFNLDDLSPFMANPSANIQDVQPVAMLSPYHRFWFSPGFEVLPSRHVASNPSLEKLILQFDPSTSSVAKISVGPQKTTSCFNFNFYGSNLGCKSNGPGCVFNFTGLRYDYESGQENVAVSQAIQILACDDREDCNMVPIKVSGFEHLTSVTINMIVDSEETPWWIDGLSLGWSDNTCETAACRSTVHEPVRKRERDIAERKMALRRRVSGLF